MEKSIENKRKKLNEEAWVKASLGGTTKNHFKQWLRSRKQPNHFCRSFSLNVFTTIDF